MKHIFYGNGVGVGVGGLYPFGSSPPIIFIILITLLFFGKLIKKLKVHTFRWFSKNAQIFILFHAVVKYLKGWRTKLCLQTDGLGYSNIPPYNLLAGVFMLLLARQTKNIY